MPSHVRSAALNGIDAIPVDVEVDVLAGLPSFTVVGLGDTAVKESKERMTSALTNTGFTPPRRKTIVSMAPASLKKEGSLYDLPITIGFLLASKQITSSPEILENSWFIGELGLDGTVRSVNGALPIALAAIQAGIKNLYIPSGNANETSAVADQINLYVVDSLQHLVDHLSKDTAEYSSLAPLRNEASATEYIEPEVNFAHIKGQDHAKRALLIAAASSHNVLLVGPPGTGKTLLARALAGILPPLSLEESHIVTSLYSIAGQLDQAQGIIKHRPFRAPHHGASSVALVGGGTHPKPGEVSLAHNGVLFLDELPEFAGHVLDQLRQPIEDGVVTISRAAHSVKYPARSQLVGAMNPCKCGYVGSTRRECNCTPGDILRYQRRVSGPLLDRFDLHVLVADVPMDELLGDVEPANITTSRELSEKAQAARQTAIQRQGKTNSELTPQEVKEICQIDEGTKKLLYQAEDRFKVSARGVHRLLKVARTIADLEGEDSIKPNHLAEALQYREQLSSALPEFV